ncbi:hypothetical protein [uncultured Metabacillus sp.]|nr:hypothetical protein [uncultured Metabacillus sp.]
MYETWAIVFMGLGAISLWALLVMFIMSIMIAASKADDVLLKDRQYHD